jgi:hypothetical protein
MKRNEIKSLSYRDFKNNTNEIENRINYYFKGKKMVERKMFRQLNLLFWGLDMSKPEDFIELKSEGKLITNLEQEFYVDKSKPSFIIKIDATITILFGDDNIIICPPNNDPPLYHISIRILK